MQFWTKKLGKIIYQRDPRKIAFSLVQLDIIGDGSEYTEESEDEADQINQRVEPPLVLAVHEEHDTQNHQYLRLKSS